MFSKSTKYNPGLRLLVLKLTTLVKADAVWVSKALPMPSQILIWVGYWLPGCQLAVTLAFAGFGKRFRRVVMLALLDFFGLLISIPEMYDNGILMMYAVEMPKLPLIRRSFTKHESMKDTKK